MPQVEPHVMLKTLPAKGLGPGAEGPGAWMLHVWTLFGEECCQGTAGD